MPSELTKAPISGDTVKVETQAEDAGHEGEAGQAGWRAGVECDEGVYSKEHSLDIVHASASKAFVSENSLSSSASGNALGGFGGKVGNS